MTKWRVGTTPLRPKPTNTPKQRNNFQTESPWKRPDYIHGHTLQEHNTLFTCSDCSILWRREKVALWYYDGSQSQDTHNNQVDEAGLRRTVEGVVQPGDEGAHDQEGNPTVVQSIQKNISQTLEPFPAFTCTDAKHPTVESLTWKRFWTRPLSDSRLCGRARRRRGRGWLREKTSQSLPSPGLEPRKTCWVWTCTWDPGRGRTGSLQEKRD